MMAILKQCLEPGGSCLNMLDGKYIQLENNRNLDGNVSKSPRLHLGERLTIVRRSTKHRLGGRLIRITYRVVCGDPKELPLEYLSNPCDKNPIAIKDNGGLDLQLWQLA